MAQQAESQNFMTDGIETIGARTPIIEVAEMFKGSFKRYPVVKENHLVGTITCHHILRALEFISSPESTQKPAKALAKQSVHS